jgi:hypothetical protein
MGPGNLASRQPMNTNFKTALWAACFSSVGAVMLISPGAQAQNLFATAGSGILEYSPGGAQSTFASGLSNVGGMAFDAAGDMFVSSGSGYITKITPWGAQSLFATGLHGPAGMAFDSSGNLFVGNTTSASITKITPAGAQSTFTSQQQSAIDDPVALAFNHAGNLFVANYGDGNILEYTPSGAPSFFAGQLGNSGPSSLAFNRQGDLFVTDRIPNDPYLHGDIYEITPNGTVTTFASGIYNPTALAVDNAGDVFVVGGIDGGVGGNDKIYEFTPGGVESTFATTTGQFVNLAFATPEPSAFELLAVGLGGMAVLRARHR